MREGAGREGGGWEAGMKRAAGRRAGALFAPGWDGVWSVVCGGLGGRVVEGEDRRCEGAVSPGRGPCCVRWGRGEGGGGG